jgi:hypothetical protein
MAITEEKVTFSGVQDVRLEKDGNEHADDHVLYENVNADHNSGTSFSYTWKSHQQFRG